MCSGDFPWHCHRNRCSSDYQYCRLPLCLQTLIDFIDTPETHACHKVMWGVLCHLFTSFSPFLFSFTPPPSLSLPHTYRIVSSYLQRRREFLEATSGELIRELCKGGFPVSMGANGDWAFGSLAPLCVHSNTSFISRKCFPKGCMIVGIRMLSCLGTATDLLDIPRQMTCMNPACTCRIV